MCVGLGLLKGFTWSAFRRLSFDFVFGFSSFACTHCKPQNGDCMQHIDQPRMLYLVPGSGKVACDDELLGTGTKNTYVNAPE